MPVDSLEMFSKSRVPALLFIFACCLSASNWIIVRKDGAKIECRGPFAVVDDRYLCQDAAGKNISLPASEVDAVQTTAANRALSERPTPAAQSQPERAPTPEEAYASALRVQQLLETRRFGELTEALEAK